MVLRNVRRVPLVKSWRPRKWPLYLEGALNLTLASCQCLERRFDIGLLRLECEKQCFSVQMRKVENHVLWTFSIIQFAKPKKKNFARHLLRVLILVIFRDWYTVNTRFMNCTTFVIHCTGCSCSNWKSSKVNWTEMVNIWPYVGKAKICLRGDSFFKFFKFVYNFQLFV